MRGGEAFAQCCADRLETKLDAHLLKDCLVAVQVQLAAGNIRAFRLKAQAQLRIFFIADSHVDILHQIFHDRLRFCRCPQLFTIV